MRGKLFNVTMAGIVSAIALIHSGCNPDDGGTADNFLPRLGAACVGEGVPGAGFYAESDPGFHPIGLMDDAGAVDEFNDMVVDAWRPRRLAEAELVACISPLRERTVGRCRYNQGPDIILYQYDRDVVLREAASARVIDQETLRGSRPGCPGTAPYSQTREEGSRPGFGAVEAYLRPFVEQ